MNKIISKTLVLTVLLFISAWSFGQTLSVTVLTRGQNCPNNGTVISRWKYVKGGNYQVAWFDGTSAGYSFPSPPTPQTVIVLPIWPGGNWFLDNQVRVTVEPKEHPEGNNTLIQTGFAPIGISPNPCDIQLDKPIPISPY